MKKLYIILSLITLLVLASCSSSNDMHSMDDGSEMQWATHEESKNLEENMMSPETQIQETETQSNNQEMMEEIDEESIVWDGSMHSMDDGSTMEWATHEESENHIEWDSHEMEDGSEMQWATHSEWM